MDTSTAVPAPKRGRPKGSKNRRMRGPNKHRPLPLLTPEEIFEKREMLNFVPNGESTIDKLIKERKFPRPLYVGNKRIWTGAQIIAYRTALARGEQWQETE